MNISVIITSFNESEYISTAIESVINQNKAPNELILIDAGSTDGTRSIISDYANEYSFIKYKFTHRNVNIPKMRNLALKQASGPLVTFLDGDDKFRPEKLEKEYELYTSCPEANIIFSNVCEIDSDGYPLNVWFDNELPPTGNILGKNASRDWPTGSLYRNELISLDLLYEVGMYDENLMVYEDWDLKIRTSAKTQAAYCPEILTEYRQHDSSISTRIPRSELRNASRYIYLKNKNLIRESLDQKQASEVLKAMEKHILEHSIHASKEEGNYDELFYEYLRWLLKSGSDKYKLERQASLLLPENIKKYLTRFLH